VAQWDWKPERKMEWLDVLYPFLMMCGFSGLMLLVGIGSSYLWLVWWGKEATKCPECGKRGAGELVESKVTRSRVYTEWRDRWGIFGRDASKRQLIQVTEKTYEDHFKCEHCGYRWTKTAHEKKHTPRVSSQ
jgi:transcription elongation factor Elf1